MSALGTNSLDALNRGNLIRRIDLTTLQLFVAIWEEGNLTRAATRESIAPSAVSKRLNDLEAALRYRCSPATRKT